MASFADNIPQFKPYVSQLPVELMTKVGMYKQEKYDQGVEKLQSYFDNVIGGMDMANEADRQYAQSLIDQVGNNMKWVAAGDFSNQQLVNSVGNMAKQITKDPNILNAVSSTALYRQQRAKIQKDVDEGKADPANVDDFDMQAAPWLNSKKVGQKFNGQYTPFYDIDKDVNEAIKAAHFDGAEWEELPKKVVQSVDKQGKPIFKDGKPVTETVVDTDVLVQKSKKGLLSGKVANIVGSVFDKPAVQRQLYISGKYAYKNYTPEKLKEIQDSTLEFYTKKANQLKAEYEVQNAISSKDANKSNSAVLAIDQDLIDQRKKYDEFMDLLDAGKFDQARVKLYTENQLERYKSNLSWEENSMKTVVNPVFTAAMTRANYNLAVTREQFDQFNANRNYDLSVRNTAVAEAGERRQQLIAAGKLNPDGSPKIIYTKKLGIDPAQEAKIGSQTFLESVKGLVQEKNQIEAKIISGLPGYQDMYDFKNGKYVLSQTALNMGTDEYLRKHKLATDAMNKAYLNGTLNNNYKADVQKYYDLTSLISEANQKRIEIDSKFKGGGMLGNLIPDIATVGRNRANSITGRVGSWISGESNYLTKPQIVTNSDTKENIEISKNDLIQFYLWENSDNPSLKLAATSYLKSKFGQDIQNSGLYKHIYGRSSGAGEKRGGQFGNDYYRPYVKNVLDKSGEEVLNSYIDRENAFKAIQLQSLPYAGTFNIGKTEDKININTFYQKALSEIMGDDTGGAWSETAKMLDPSKPEELNANLYSYAKDRKGNYFLQVSRNDGSGGFKHSPAIPTTPDVIAQMNVKEDPNEVAFNTTFGPFLDMNGGSQTTKNLMDPNAAVTALKRKSIGKYSVGYHLREFDGGYVPFLYIQDNDGNEIRRGLQLDFSVFSKDPRLSAQQRAAASQATTIISKQDVLSKVDMFLNSEKDIELLLKN